MNGALVTTSMYIAALLARHDASRLMSAQILHDRRAFDNKNNLRLVERRGTMFSAFQLGCRDHKPYWGPKHLSFFDESEASLFEMFT
jgi:hypothetical protein